MSDERRIPVAVEGGWSGDGTMRLTLSDPHNGTALFEVTIPERTFVNCLRNLHDFQPPLGEARLFPAAIDRYGLERQVASILVPCPNTGRSTRFTEWTSPHIPDGWTSSDTEFNGHRRTPEGRYRLPIFRYVEPGTPRQVEGHPDRDVHSSYVTPEEWGRR